MGSKEAAKEICKLLYNNSKIIYIQELSKELDICKSFKEIDPDFALQYYNCVGEVRIKTYETYIESCEEIINFIMGL